MQTSMKRRICELEKRSSVGDRGPVILIGPDDCCEEALAELEKCFGPQEGEPFFIRLVGVEPKE